MKYHRRLKTKFRTKFGDVCKYYLDIIASDIIRNNEMLRVMNIENLTKFNPKLIFEWGFQKISYIFHFNDILAN